VVDPRFATYSRLPVFSCSGYDEDEKSAPPMLGIDSSEDLDYAISAEHNEDPE
jgi:hypothetical protein